MQYVAPMCGLIVALLGVIGAGALVRNVDRRSLVVALQETADGWKASHDQVKSALTESQGRTAELERRVAAVEESERKYRELNLSLQVQIAERDRRITALEAELASLTARVRDFEAGAQATVVTRARSAGTRGKAVE